MPSVLRSVAVLAFASAVAVVSASGCSQQGQGERCDFAKNGDGDCDSGLTCVKSGELADRVTDRCCPAANTETDSRCARGTPVAATGGTSSTGGSASAGQPNGGAAGEPAAGSPSIPAGEGGMSGGGAPAEAGAGTPADASAGTGGAG